MKKRILFIPTMVLPIPDTKGGAIERLLTSLIEENEKEELAEFIILSVFEPKAAEIAKSYRHTKIRYQRRKSVVLENLFMYTYVAFRKIFHLHLPFFNPNYLSVLNIVEETKPDLIVMEGSGGENLVSLLKKRKREVFYLHMHHEFSPNSTLMKTFGTVISPSYYIEKKWKEKSFGRRQDTKVVFNGIDEKRFETESFDREKERKKKGFATEDFLILFCGRIIEEKGVRELIGAFKKLNMKNAKLIVIGSVGFGNKIVTSYSEEIKNEMENEKNICYPGYVPNDQMTEYYKIADLLVVPTLIEEAAGMVAIEAMACGLPVLATNTGGLPEYVGEAGVLVQKDGLSREELEKKLAKQIKLLAEDPQKLEIMSRKGKIRAKQFTNGSYYVSFMKAIGVMKDG